MPKYFVSLRQLCRWAVGTYPEKSPFSRLVIGHVLFMRLEMGSINQTRRLSREKLPYPELFNYREGQ